MLTAQRRMCATVEGALSETVATVSLRTEKMLSMFRLWNQKCSETGPNRRCSGPEQCQKRFWYDLYWLVKGWVQEPSKLKICLKLQYFGSLPIRATVCTDQSEIWHASIYAVNHLRYTKCGSDLQRRVVTEAPKFQILLKSYFSYFLAYMGSSIYWWRWTL